MMWMIHAVCMLTIIGLAVAAPWVLIIWTEVKWWHLSFILVILAVAAFATETPRGHDQ